MSELKPCKRCKSDDIRISYPQSDYDLGLSALVVCQGCGNNVSSPLAKGSRAKAVTTEEATAAWNDL